MNRDLHKTMATRIASELGFSSRDSYIFVDGCLGPDSHGDFPHEIGKKKQILSNIDRARTSYFLKDEYAYGELGNALHYIQDRWVANASGLTETTLFDDDSLLQDQVNQLVLPEQTKAEYKCLANNLGTIKALGIEAWFDHSWGIWHKDYASCVFVFADIVELMLPTLAPNIARVNNKEKLQEYVNSKAFEKATKEGFLASTITNFVYPKLSGYPAAVYSLATMEPPLANEATEVANLNMVYRLSLELARYTLSPSSIFKFQDSWTRNAEEEKHMSLALIMPEYHVLIPKPTVSIQKERNLCFYDEAKDFLEKWPIIRQALVNSNSRSEKWKILLSGLVGMLG